MPSRSTGAGTSEKSAVREARGSIRPATRWALDHALPRVVMGRLARRGDLQGQLITGGSDADPYPVFEQIRRAGGQLHQGRIGYITTSHAVVKEVLASNDFHVGFDRSRLPGPLKRVVTWSHEGAPIGPLTPPALLAVEPPDHTRYRKLVTRVFTARAVEKLRTRAEQVATELLDDLADSGSEVDLVERYCSLLPVTMIAEILGVPADERELVLGFGEGAAPSLDLGLSWRDFRHVESSLHDFEQWLTTHVARLRADPGDDLLSQLVAVRDEGRGLDDQELRATAGLVLAAGFETTVNLLGNGARLLVEHPDQLAGLLRDGDDDAWRNAVDEVLRYDPPVLLTGRTAQTDIDLAGKRVLAGSMVTTALAAANRDPEVFATPNDFDVTRPNAGDHVSFSGGRHFCLGAALARMEGEVGLSTLFRRYPSMQLIPGARRRSTRILRGYATLPVRLGEARVAP